MSQAAPLDHRQRTCVAINTVQLPCTHGEKESAISLSYPDWKSSKFCPITLFFPQLEKQWWEAGWLYVHHVLCRNVRCAMYICHLLCWRSKLVAQGFLRPLRVWTFSVKRWCNSLDYLLNIQTITVTWPNRRIKSLQKYSKFSSDMYILQHFRTVE